MVSTANTNLGDDSPTSLHVPVLLEKAIELLNVRPGLTYVDATAGGGGHLKLIGERLGNSGRIIGIDRDLTTIERLRSEQASSSIAYVHANFANLSSELAKLGINTVSGGILADLGVSSMQIDDPTRGFSFTKVGPLDMRMDTAQKLSAAELVNGLGETELANLIFKFGEEKDSRAIAREIVRSRPLETTEQLASAVMRATRRRKSHSRGHGSKSKRAWGATSIHPATRTFQAIRIAVNAELDSLNLLLEQACDLLAPGARLVVITFHSLEDRLVKDFFRLEAAFCICPPRQPVCTCDKKQRLLIITKKPFTAEEKEVLANVRSRSAKLRAGEKLP